MKDLKYYLDSAVINLHNAVHLSRKDNGELDIIECGLYIGQAKIYLLFAEQKVQEVPNSHRYTQRLIMLINKAFTMANEITQNSKDCEDCTDIYYLGYYCGITKQFVKSIIEQYQMDEELLKEVIPENSHETTDWEKPVDNEVS